MKDKIRVPNSCEKFLIFCKPYFKKNKDYIIWESYYSMVMFMACYGFGKNPDYKYSPTASDFLKNDPDPIDYSIFNHNAMNEIAIVAISFTDDPHVLNDSNKVIKIIEKFADAGGKMLSKAFDELGTETEFVEYLETEIIQTNFDA